MESAARFRDSAPPSTDDPAITCKDRMCGHADRPAVANSHSVPSIRTPGWPALTSPRSVRCDDPSSCRGRAGRRIGGRETGCSHDSGALLAKIYRGDDRQRDHSGMLAPSPPSESHLHSSPFTPSPCLPVWLRTGLSLRPVERLCPALCRPDPRACPRRPSRPLVRKVHS